jgi:SPP1 family predicted phage head-tail adaptor
VNAGRLRHRVTFESLTVVLDSDGAQDEAWVDAFGMPISAEIEPLSGRELIAAQAVQSKVSVRIKVRYRTGFLASMRAVHRGTIYNIEAVVPDPDSGIRGITLLCSTGVNEG